MKHLPLFAASMLSIMCRFWGANESADIFLAAMLIIWGMNK